MSVRLRTLPLLSLLLPALALGEANDVRLREAAEFLSDVLPEKARSYAVEVYCAPDSTPDQRDRALEILFAALDRMNAHEEALSILDNGLPGGPPLPADGRDALWRAAALKGLGQCKEAVQALSAALENREEIAPGIARQLELNLPPMLLAAGKTNGAIRVYNALRYHLRSEEPDIALRLSLDLNRLYAAMGIATNALDLAGLPAPPPDVADEMRTLRAIVDTAPDADDRLLAVAEDGSMPAALRSEAFLELVRRDAGADGVHVAVYADKVLELATDSPQAFLACRIAAPRLCEAGNRTDAERFLRLALASPLSTVESRTGLLLSCAQCLAASSPEEALALYDEFLRNDAGIYSPTPIQEAWAHFGRGECLAGTNPDAAAGAFARAGEIADAAGDGDLRDMARFRRARALLLADPRSNDAIRLLELCAGDESTLPLSDRADAALLIAQAIEASSPDLCEEAYRSVINRFPDAQKAVQYALMHLAGRAFDRNDYAVARDRYRAAAENLSVKADPDVLCRAYVGEGLSSAHIYEFNDAEKAFALAEGTGAQNVTEASFLRACALYNLEREEDAADICRSILRSESPDSPWFGEAAFWLGAYHYNRGDYYAAATNLTSLPPSHPQAPDALFLAAQAYLATNDFRMAQDMTSRFLANHPSSPLRPKILLLRGRALRSQYAYAEAVLSYDDIIREWPVSEEAIAAGIGKGRCLFALGVADTNRYVAAEDCLRNLLNAPTPPAFEETLEIHYWIGRCRENLNDGKGAFDEYNENVIHPFREMEGNGVLPSRAALQTYVQASLRAADLAETPETAQQLLRALQRSDIPPSEREAIAKKLSPLPSPTPSP